MKQSVLSACAAIVQKEIEFYAGFTCLEYDVNDENTMRVAGTGIFRSIIYANENQPYSAIEQAKADRKLIFVRNRNSPVCRKCSTNRICTGRAEVVVPLYIKQAFLGTLSVLCYDEKVHRDMLEHTEYYKNLAIHVGQVITRIAESYLLEDALHVTEHALSDMVDTMEDGAVLIENRRVSKVNKNARLQMQRMGIGEDLFRETVKVIKGKNSDWLNLRAENRSIRLHAKHQIFDSDFLMGKRLEYVVLEQNLVTEQNYFQDASRNLSLDYFEGTSEILTKMKQDVMKISEISRYLVIQGERGLGKEMWVKAIHNSGRYAQQELVIFDCNAFSDLNFANQVFDEETGIFCGRDITVCLKEIPRLPYWLQLKLADNITLLENHNIRLIATTLEDLSKMADHNAFSKRLFNLFYPAILCIPPIRERDMDIDYYIQKYLIYYQDFEKKKVACSSRALTMLKNHSWPGNFKQMEQVLSYLISINTSGIITEEDVLRLPDFKQNDGPFNLKEQERQLIQKALQRFTGPYGKQAAADALGISKATLYRKIQEYRLDGA